MITYVPMRVAIERILARVTGVGSGNNQAHYVYIKIPGGKSASKYPIIKNIKRLLSLRNKRRSGNRKRADYLTTYKEPFLGSASILLEAKKQNLFDHYVGSDKDAELINILVETRDNNKELAKEFISIALNLKEMNPFELFGKVKNDFRGGISNTTKRAANALFLNRTTNGGLWPRHSMAAPIRNWQFPSPKKIEEIGRLLKGVELYAADYRETFKNISRSDFLYIDPPFLQQNTSVNYPNRFFMLDHIELMGHILLACAKRAGFVGTFKNSPWFKEAYSTFCYLDDFSWYNKGGIANKKIVSWRETCLVALGRPFSEGQGKSKSWINMP